MVLPSWATRPFSKSNAWTECQYWIVSVCAVAMHAKLNLQYTAYIVENIQGGKICLTCNRDRDSGIDFIWQLHGPLSISFHVYRHIFSVIITLCASSTELLTAHNYCTQFTAQTHFNSALSILLLLCLYSKNKQTQQTFYRINHLKFQTHRSKYGLKGLK